MAQNPYKALICNELYVPRLPGTSVGQVGTVSRKTPTVRLLRIRRALRIARRRLCPCARRSR